MNIPKITNKRQFLQSNYIKRHYPDFYDYINTKYSNINEWMEKLYLYYNNLEEPPKCANPDCNKPAKFISLYKGYQKHCCAKCSKNDPVVQEKIKHTNLERYGAESHFQSEIVKNKIKQTNLERYGCECSLQNEIVQVKVKKTNLERYGHENPMQSKEIQNKMKKTNLEKYGVENPMQSKEVQGKAKQTNLDRYGCENPMQSKEIQNKMKKTNLEKYGVENPFASEEIKDKIKQTNLKKYGVEYITQSKEVQEKAKQTNLERYGVDNIFKLPNFYELYPNTPQPTSKAEIDLQNYIEQLGYQIVRNARDIIKGYELDIYIPNLKIAIEYNGSYWHSIINKEPKYHMNKWMACYNAGIELINIWDSWNTDIVYKFIKDKLKGSNVNIYKNLIFPNLKEWPLDLGYYPNSKMDINNIKEHFCTHGGFECYDTGIYNIS